MTHLVELFMSICVMTTLQCEDVNIDYERKLRMDIRAAAVIYEDGQYGVLFHNQERSTRIREKRNLMIHEVAHLIIFERNPENPSTVHDDEYREVCNALAKDAGLMSGATVCSNAIEVH